MPGVFDPSWTTPSAAHGGMHRRPNAAVFMTRTTRVGKVPKALTLGAKGAHFERCARTKIGLRD